MTDKQAIDITAALNDMCQSLQNLMQEKNRNSYELVGIHTGGVWIAKAIQQRLGHASSIGELNIAFYRDDFSRIGMHPTVKPSALPFSVEGQHIVLIDDVLYTGRTIRAAMNELFDYGRPASITLMTLIQRSGHELPIQADIVGKTLALEPNEHVKLSGPEPLDCVISVAES